MRAHLYHFTDTARLPWIIRSGELRPGRNRIGGYPDPDFLWATTDPTGDMTSSADRGEAYRSGKVRHVRFTLDADGFVPWAVATKDCPQWTPEQIVRLENAAKGKSSPLTWWCRERPLPLASCLRIETRSYQNNRWLPLPAQPDTLGAGHGWLALRIGGGIFASRQVDGPNGSTAYMVQVSR